MLFKLEKLSLDEDKDSMVPSGYSVTGNILYLYDYKTDEKEVIRGIEGVKTGWQVVLAGLRDHIRTSPIKEIIYRTPTWVKFRTQTSVYLLTKVE
jgi:hypothetical protein